MTDLATHRVPIPGIPPHGEGTSALAATPRAAMDHAVAELRDRRGAWVALPIGERRALLARLRRDFLGVAERWAAACAAAGGLPDSGETAITGPYFVMRNLRLLDRSLADIAAGTASTSGTAGASGAAGASGTAGTSGTSGISGTSGTSGTSGAAANAAGGEGVARGGGVGAPRIPGAVRRRPDGQVTAGVFPVDLYDRLFYGGVTAEVWMEPGVTVEGLAATQAVAYRQPDGGGVALVLGAGNVSSIGPMDALYKLFVENRVVLYKAHPVNAYLGPLLEEGFAALVEGGFFRQVYGGAEEGAFLCSHSGVDEIHITGSDKTYEAIVFGPGLEGQERKRRRTPRLDKPVSAELGNVSPVIVVPSPEPWTDGDLAYQAQNLATMLANNAGFNCNAMRVLIQHASSPDRGRLLAALEGALAALPPRRAFYPGAVERHRAFLEAHPDADEIGDTAPGQLPWTLVTGLDPAARGDICYTTEAFCSLCGETAIAAGSVAEYLDRAVEFANDTLWGTLNITLIVAPAALADPDVRAAFERAIANLRYGTVAVNHWAALGYGLVVTPWGAFPGATPDHIESGNGVVHNTLMFSRLQKCVVRAPFHARPKPAWFAGHRTAARLTPLLTRFEAAPSPAKLPGIFSLALRG